MAEAADRFHQNEERRLRQGSEAHTSVAYGRAGGGVSPPSMQLRWLAMISVAMSLSVGSAAAASADATAEVGDPKAWLAALGERVLEDVIAGRPLVAQVHAPLCDASIIPCGNAKLGDGDALATNLYWATTPGFGRWFGRRGGGWTKVLEQRGGETGGETGDRDVLTRLVYRRTMAAPAAWRKRGAPKRFDVYVVISGWRGKAIDRALAAYARELSGLDARTLEVAAPGEKLGARPDAADALALERPAPTRTTIAAGGAAHLVAYSGHNRLMDVEAYEWPAPAARPIGAIAVACLTASYMDAAVPAATRVPLLMTRDFLFANAAPVEAVVLAFARGGGYAEMRREAAAAYAGVQKKETKRVLGAFTNPADARWRKAR